MKKLFTLLLVLVTGFMRAGAQAPPMPDMKEVTSWKDRSLVVLLAEEDQKMIKKMAKKNSEWADNHKAAVASFNDNVQKIFADQWKFNEEKSFETAKQAKDKIKKRGKNMLVAWLYFTQPAEMNDKNPYMMPVLALSRGENFDDEKPELTFNMPYVKSGEYATLSLLNSYTELHIRTLCHMAQFQLNLMANNKKKLPMNNMMKSEATKGCADLKNVILLIDNEYIDTEKITDKVLAETMGDMKYKMAETSEIATASEQGSDSYAYLMCFPVDIKSSVKGEVTEYSLQVAKMVLDCKTAKIMYMSLSQPGGKNAAPEFNINDFRAISACVPKK